MQVLIGFLVISCVPIYHGQTFTYQNKVIDAETLDAIPNAKIYFLEISGSYYTNMDFFYNCDSLINIDTLMAKLISYEKFMLETSYRYPYTTIDSVLTDSAGTFKIKSTRKLILDFYMHSKFVPAYIIIVHSENHIRYVFGIRENCIENEKFKELIRLKNRHTN